MQKTLRTEESRGKDFCFPDFFLISNKNECVNLEYAQVEGGNDPDDLEELEDAQSLAKVNFYPSPTVFGCILLLLLLLSQHR